MVNFIINKIIKKLSNRKKRTKYFKNLDDIHSVLVLFETSEYADTELFISTLTKLGKQVTSCGYVTKKDSTQYKQFPSRIFLYPKKDMNLIKLPSKALINELNAKRYDIIIDLTLKKNPTMEYLLLVTPSFFKVGLKKDNDCIYDFSISFPASSGSLSVNFLGAQIIHYLQTIHSV